MDVVVDEKSQHREERRAALVAFAGDMAFDYAEAGWCREGKELAEWALALDPRDANAAHAMAHALAEDGEHAATAAFVERWLDGYPAGAPEYSHLAWHLGISRARLGHAGEALRVYRERLDPARTPGTRLRDAAGLLWRLHLDAALEGTRAALPWGPVRDLAARLAGAPLNGLDAIHAAMAFAAVGDAAEAMRLELTLRRQGQDGDANAEAVTLPFVRGVLAFGERRYAEAARLMAPVAAELPRLGASNGQASNVLLTLRAARPYIPAGHDGRSRRGRHVCPAARAGGLAQAGGGNGQPGHHRAVHPAPGQRQRDLGSSHMS
jgi:hypothetical protein